MNTNRRKFVKKNASLSLATGVATALPFHIFASNNSPNERVNIGLIGCKKEVCLFWDSIYNNPKMFKN